MWYANKLRKKGVTPKYQPKWNSPSDHEKCTMRFSPKYSYPPGKALQCMEHMASKQTSFFDVNRAWESQKAHESGCWQVYKEKAPARTSSCAVADKPTQERDFCCEGSFTRTDLLMTAAMARRIRKRDQPLWDQPKYHCPFCPDMEPFKSLLSHVKALPQI